MGIQLSRSDFCKLAGVELEQLNALRRRDQLPLVPNADLPEEIANERGYTPTGALLLTVATEFAVRFEVSRQVAARIAVCGLSMFNRWRDISATSAQVASGKEPTIDVLLGVVDWPGLERENRKSRPKIALGSLKEVGSRYPTARDIIAISVTRCAALMRQRAAKAGIDLSQFWEN